MAATAKIRIYELAKELGLTNKALLSLCEQIGVEGKTSHSNSLSDDEAEKIRRFVIRRAVSDRGDVVREVNREGRLMTERRRGNVIRRRKKIDEEEPEMAEEDVREEDAQPEAVESAAPEEVSADSALAEADALFDTPGESQAEEVEAVEDSDVVVEAEVSATEEEVQDQEVESTLEAEAGDTEEVGDELSDAEFEAVRAAEGIDDEAEFEVSEDAKLEDIRKRHAIRAPKVLGKIALPQEAPPKPKEEKLKPQEAGPSKKEESKPTKGQKKRGAGRRAQGDVESQDGPRRRRKKQVLKKDDLLDYDTGREGWRGRRDKKKRPKEDRGDAAGIAPTKASKLVVKIEGEISVGELAKQMGVKAGELIKNLMGLGVMANINQMIDFDTASLVVTEFGYTVARIGLDEEELIKGVKAEDAPETLQLRPPVVTVMGHVDHGKTSLLDVIRKTEVTESEAGGITQHIGAYNVKLQSGGSVTFLDTPGHEAFTSMRSRGAEVTDIVVLVVAADDGVKPQTVEAINHAKAADVPIIVAVNKMDKEGANIDRVKNEIAEHELVPEEWGGDTLMVPVSAKTREGIDDLLENLHLQAELLELKANPDRLAIGTVVESKLDKGRGPVMTVLVQRGTLKKGQAFLAGAVIGRVKALVSDDGKMIDEAGPSIPVEVLGASSPPLAGDDFLVLESEAEAKKLAETRAERLRARNLAAKSGGLRAPLTLESFSDMVGAGELKEIPIIVKADVQGSVEAVSDALGALQNDEARVRIIHKGVGAITENDVQLAVASNAIVIGFNIRASTSAAIAAEQEKVDIRYSRVIYELVEMVESALKGMLAPVFQEKTLGRVEVRDTFRVPKLGVIAGSYVVDGAVKRGALIRLLRDNTVVHEGKMASLRRFKDDVKEVAAGYECGIGIDGYSDIKVGDVIEVYRMEEAPR